MKIIKYIFLLLLLSAVSLTVFIATQTGSYYIKEEKLIDIPKNVVFGYVNDYANWNHIHILAETDSTTVYTSNDSISGEGTEATWQSGEFDGRIQTVRTAAFDTIKQNAYTGTHLTEVLWTFKDTLNTTKVSVRVKGELTFKEKAYALLQGNTGERYEKSLQSGLEHLKNYLTEEISAYNITVKGKAVKKEAFYLGFATTSSITGISQRVSSVLPRLRQFVADNNITTAGRAFVLYNKYDKLNGSAAYSVCIPITEEIYTTPPSEFTGGKLYAFPAYKTTLKGDYSHLKEAWAKTYAQLEEKGIPVYEAGQYVEVLTVNMKQSKQPSKWVTDIYFPIGKAYNDSIVPATLPTMPESSRPAASIQRPANANNTGTGEQPAVRPNRVEQRPVRATPPAVENRTEEDEE